MAIAFTKGDSLKTTRTLTKAAVGHQGNSMKGMPGHIKTGQDTSSGGLKNSSGIGPHKPGPIGKKGATSVKAHFTAAKSRGSSDKSYRATSTGPAGKITQGKMESLRGRAKFSMER
jgi:hypothetical protein